MLGRYMREEFLSNREKSKSKKRQPDQLRAIAFSRWHKSCERRGKCK